MNRSRSIAIALALVSVGILTGCQTAGTSQTADNRIRVNSGAYQGDGSALGGDIKNILMAGGLDVANPMSPTVDTNRSEIARTRVPEYNTDAMVAALSDSKTRTASAAQTIKPDRPVTDAAPASKPSTALSLVADAKPAPRRKVVVDTRIEDEKAALIELASINMSASSDDAFDPIPTDKPKTEVALETLAAKKSSQPDSAASSTKTSRVRRF